MQICVEPLTGPQIALDVRPLDSVDTVRMAIHRKDGTPPDRQLLSFDGKRLEEGHTLLSCNVGARVHTAPGRLASRGITARP